MAHTHAPACAWCMRAALGLAGLWSVVHVCAIRGAGACCRSQVGSSRRQSLSVTDLLGKLGPNIK